jgi:hypothetical protein
MVMPTKTMHEQACLHLPPDFGLGCCCVNLLGAIFVAVQMTKLRNTGFEM